MKKALLAIDGNLQIIANALVAAQRQEDEATIEGKSSVVRTGFGFTFRGPPGTAVVGSKLECHTPPDWVFADLVRMLD